MASLGNLEIDLIIKTKFSLWDAIKLRIASKDVAKQFIKIIKNRKNMEDEDDSTGNEEEID